MRYSVHKTKRFDKETDKLPKEDSRRIENIFEQLKENPYVGDQLQIKILREKRLDGKRLYYLVFDDLQAVLIIALSDKKAQQKVIDFIIENINYFRNYLKELLDN